MEHLVHLALTFSEQKQDVAPYTKFQLYIYYADSLFHQQNYVLADNAYSQALQIRKYILKTKNTTKIPDTQKEILSDMEIKYKMYKCCVKMKQTKKAIELLQSISARNRSAKVNMALGDLYKKTGFDRSAITCYKEVLRENPAALEAAESLLKLGVKGTEVNAMMLDATSELGWINSWMRGLAQMHSRDFSNAITTFRSIELLQDNTILMTAKAYCYLYLCDEKRALAELQRAVLRDPNMIHGRDLLANLLANSSDKEHLKELERLMHVDIDIAHWSCEHWIVLGWYWFATKKYEKAAHFARQACLMNRKNVEALLLMAHTLMQITKYLDALLNFKDAVRYCPYRFDGHKGLVECNYAMRRIREGLTMAANGCKQLNNSPQSLTLYASALMKDVTSVSTGKVQSLLDRALTADPSYTPAIYLLAEHLEQEQRHEESCTILLKHVEKYPTSRTHQLLANCYARLQKDEEAFTHFNAALRLDPHNQRATEGLNGLGRSPKLESSFYMSVTGESSSYASQGPSIPTDELDESDSDPWPSHSDFLSYD